MTTFSQALEQGSAHAWLFIPSAVILGALHGLEPGHSKTMMAAFIVAVRGTIAQAVLLGLAAAFSHSLVIWLLAVVALRYGSQWNAETTEPYFQLASGVIVAALALWMFWRTRRDVKAAAAHAHEHHHHDHEDGPKRFETGYGLASLTVYEDGVPPVFRLAFSQAGQPVVPQPAAIALETSRDDGTKTTFAFVEKGDFLESATAIPEPHDFEVTLTVTREGQAQPYTTRFVEHPHHGLSADDPDFQDAHEAAHALDIQKRFANREVSTGQIVLFGLTGGLLPCPAAFTVLIVCMQLKEFTLGFAMVAAFSFGLALTMVSVGALAAWSLRHAERKYRGVGEALRKAPYFSCVLLLALAAYMIWHGWQALGAHH